MSGPAAGVRPGDDDLDGEAGRFDWEVETAILTDENACLEFVIHGFAVPAVPLSLTDEALSLAIPAEVAPWLPPLMHPLADPATGLPSNDGAVVTCSFEWRCRPVSY